EFSRVEVVGPGWVIPANPPTASWKGTTSPRDGARHRPEEAEVVLAVPELDLPPFVGGQSAEYRGRLQVTDMALQAGNGDTKPFEPGPVVVLVRRKQVGRGCDGTPEEGVPQHPLEGEPAGGRPNRPGQQVGEAVQRLLHRDGQVVGDLAEAPLPGPL